MKKFKKIMPAVAFVTIVVVLSGAFFVTPVNEYSPQEKRILTDTVEIHKADITGGTLPNKIQAYVSDQFPFRNVFVGLYSYFRLLTGANCVNDVYFCKDGYLISAPQELDLKTAEKNIKRFEEFSSKNSLSGSLVVVPGAGSVMEEKLPRFHKGYRDEEICSVAENTVKSLSYIDVASVIKEKKDSVQFYYKTDHHLTTGGTYEIYKKIGEASGWETPDVYKKEIVENFYGTTYSRSGYWLTESDDIEIYRNEKIKPTVEIQDSSGEVKKYNDFFFMENAEDGCDKYTIFLDGNHGYEKITSSVKNGRKLLVIKDSYAHCLVPFLSEQYEEIHMVDLRYYRKPLSPIVKEEGIKEVMFVYGAENLATDTNSTWLH